MIQNTLDPAVAVNPDNLILYSGRVKTTRSWEVIDATLKTLRNLEPAETLMVQSENRFPQIRMCALTKSA